MFNRIDGPIDEHTWALFQYTPLAPDGLFASTDFWKINTIEANVLLMHLDCCCSTRKDID